MSFKRITLFVLILFVSMSATGCYDSLDVNAQSLITAVVLDYENDEYVFHIEIPRLQAGQKGEDAGGSVQKQNQIYWGSGKTLAEARQDLDYKIEYPIFLGTVRILILTHNAARHGIAEYMYRMQNDKEYRKAVNVITTREKPKDLLSAQVGNSLSVGFSIEETLNTLKKAGNKIKQSSSDVLDHLASKTCFVIPNFDLTNEKIICTGYSIIHEGTYKGFIPNKEARGLIWILGENAEWTYVVPYEDLKITVEVKLKKRKIKPVYSNEKLTLSLDFSFDSEIMYMSEDVQLDKNAEQRVNEALKQQILKHISDAVSESKRTGCEYFGFKEYFRISYPNVIKNIDWRRTYLDSDVNISVSSALKAGGLINFNPERQLKEP